MGLFDIFRRKREPGLFDQQQVQPAAPSAEISTPPAPGAAEPSFNLTDSVGVVDISQLSHVREQVLEALRAEGIDPSNPGVQLHDLDPAAAAGLKQVISQRLRSAGLPAVAPGAPGSASGDDLVDDLARLAHLKESGALREAEFEAAKAKLLGPG